MAVSVGTAVHHHIQNFLLGPMSVLFGTWKNVWTSEIVKESFHPDPTRAVKDLARNSITWEYVEYSLYDPSVRLSGHCDGVVSLERLDEFMRLSKQIKADPVQALALVPDTLLQLGREVSCNSSRHTCTHNTVRVCGVDNNICGNTQQ
jgi:hypothetical protein